MSVSSADSGDLVVLADELSGALEVGSMLAAAGFATVVSLEATPARLERGGEALVLDTESRHVAAAAARRLIHDLARAARARQPRCIFKKTDSTLRGNVSSELAGLVEACAPLPLLYAPAHPAMRRAVRRGRLTVDGVELAATAFAADGRDPVATSDVLAVVRAEIAGPVLSTSPECLRTPLQPGAVYVCDGESAGDLAAAARFFVDSGATILAAGAAPFAAALAARLSRGAPPTRPLPLIRRALVVNGSRHEISRAQVRHAEETGLPYTRAGGSPSAGWRILALPEIDREHPVAHSRRVGAAARRAVEEGASEAVVVFGGDTALGVVEAFGATEIEPLGEVLPGVALSRLEARSRPLHLLTKPGGFGPVDVIVRLARLLGADPRADVRTGAAS
jgi:uncharacterized protein YgbK (DUF1537 family)